MDRQEIDKSPGGRVSEHRQGQVGRPSAVTATILGNCSFPEFPSCQSCTIISIYYVYETLCIIMRSNISICQQLLLIDAKLDSNYTEITLKEPSFGKLDMLTSRRTRFRQFRTI